MNWEEDFITGGLATKWHGVLISYKWEFDEWRATNRLRVTAGRDSWTMGPNMPRFGHRTLAMYRRDVEASIERWWADRCAQRLLGTR